MPKTLGVEDFINRLEKRGDCLEYVGPRDKDGYGNFGAGGSNAHKFSYLTFVGDVPEGMCIRHTCDNPPCVLPAHLVVGTHQENMRDMVERGRHKTDGKKGKTYPHLQQDKCYKGHDYDYSVTPKVCRTCKNERQRKYKERKRNEDDEYY